ncbi:MAG: 1-(5-phosphoribosyl)-5-[(5-phosphoribosylamino)methylideneamino]imidazole-4-carboxamide isomerase [Candidatus Omnitrophica bacterium]|nr:1-(5-phosphoribosyl)-5-[(5-phosphoribosylamino)methylideneamino]imidazole-4-carboxamide isomerase [Candidatus Omnitrophota bacterium]MBU1048299.1 1-(5-phosphoribosyl)-5-[(5-phosphoribosylamino)methylideneamino]imidazole-4-carboxamide isomerase [Candidatus Omnitrophota bacterium]MBU1630676.1 1-(5-phosphoribosyl)-5-[(5-phosphoribosylamino)methylideneamino]imidazole-4-carboxamide isomerase [Candidatus Omnitrophota bacterium]MBU1889719.1 1-(5-phosphoribosyl)-5-[(5-phosphoribosylamino)methylidenea
MLIIPAIDLMDGKVVRLTKGDFTTSKIYSDDPVAVAKDWQEKGAKRIHIVDLDGAKTGECKNLDAVKKITEELKIPVQLGGGIRSFCMARKVLDCGARWLVLGTNALLDEKFLKEIMSSFPDKIIVSVDIKNEKIYVKGWEESSSLDVFSFITKLGEMKVSSLIVTDIQQDGMLEGVNVEFFTKICKISPVPIIVAGGVSFLEDIKHLSVIKGIEGIIIGKALYEGRIKLEEAVTI